MAFAILLASTLLLAAPGPAPQARAKAIETMNEGVELAAKGDRTAAEARLREATKADPSYDYAWLNLGVLHQQQDRPIDAAAAFREGLRVAEGKVAAELRYRLGVILLQQAEAPGLSRADRTARLADAVTQLQEAIRREPQRSRAYLHLARGYERLDEPAKADEAYRRAIELNPRLGRAYVGLGLMYVDYGHRALALAVLETGVKVNDTDAEAWMGLGQALLQLDQPAEAIEAFDKARRIDPDRREVHYHIGMAHAELGHRREAVMALEQFLSTAGADVPEAIKRHANDTIARLQDVL